jgi:hypothetical protein
MTEPTHKINLHLALEMHEQQRDRLQIELEGYLRQAEKCRDQIFSTERLIDQTKQEILKAIDSSQRGLDAYDRRSERHDDRYDRRYDQRNEPRYAIRNDDRYEVPHERQSYRPPEQQYRSPHLTPNHPADIDEAVRHIQDDEHGSNVRFADFRIPQAATIVLREANEPLHVSEIFRRLSHGGFEFRGQHQQITLAVSLARSKRFRKVAPGTFELDPAFRVA